MRNEKGFTLIELLAVIVILGILMFVAIPMVTKYITNSRKDTFVDNAKMALNQAKTQKASCDVDSTDTDCSHWVTATASGCTGKEIDLQYIQFEKKLKSPFDNTPITGKVYYCESGGTTTWYFDGAGTDGKGFSGGESEDNLDRTHVTA